MVRDKTHKGRGAGIHPMRTDSLGGRRGIPCGRPISAVTTVTGPKRPMNIVAISKSLCVK